MTRHLVFGLLLLLGCDAGEPEDARDDVAAGKADAVEDEAEDLEAIACRSRGSIDVRARPIDDAELKDMGIVAEGDLPVPSLAPDSEGFFHPPQGYLEGGRFERATDDPLQRPRAGRTLSRPEGDRIRIAEWNVARGSKLDGVIQRMKEIDADIWIINEADLYGLETDQRMGAREMARALGYGYVAAGEFYELRSDRKGMSGNAIVSRYPIVTAKTVDLPILPEQGGSDWADHGGQPRCGQRNAIGAEIETPAGVVKVVSAHLENKANKTVRRAQFHHAVDALTYPDETVVLGGDFNTLSVFEGTSFRGMLEDEGRFIDCSHGDNEGTFSLLSLRLDWMLLQRGDDALLSCAPDAYSIESRTDFSDHDIVVVDFDPSKA